MKALEYMTTMTCIIMSQAILRDDEIFKDEEDEKNFEELHQLFTTNYLIIKEFALYLTNSLIFP